jgi:UPF0755 protein
MAFDPRSFNAAAPGHDAPRYEPSRYEPARFAVPAPRVQPAHARAAAPPRHSFEAAERATGGLHRSGLLDRYADETGPLVEPEWWSHGCGDAPVETMRARHSGEDRPRPADPAPVHRPDTEHPSAPLPPRPAGVWDRLQPRHAAPADDAETVASPLLPGPPASDDADATDAHALDPAAWDDHDHDQTGGLDVIGAHVEDGGRRRGLFRRSRHTDRHPAEGYPAVEHRGSVRDDDHDLDLDLDHHDDDHHDHDHDLDHLGYEDDEIPVVPYDPRSGRRRRRRRPFALLVSLLVLGGLVVGIVIGGQKLLSLIDPTAADYTGQGSGETEIRVRNGDTLSDIARTLVDAGVIASIGPFIDAAEANPDSMGIQPGVYALREEMSGQAALDLLLDPVSRLVSRVTVPEGLTLRATLNRLAEATGLPVAEFEAAAADPVALGLPAYANGQLEGFLYPATYDMEPDTTPTEILRDMVGQFVQVATSVQLEQRAAALGRTPYEIVVVASMIQSETLLDAERPDVAQVIYNRLAQNIPLGIDATLAYGLDKNGNDLTVSDLQTDSPYNTRTRTGLPPTPISAPGEPSLEAALAPSTGTLLYYVLESQEGSHFFTDDYAEFEAARQRCAEAGLGCGG